MPSVEITYEKFGSHYAVDESGVLLSRPMVVSGAEEDWCEVDWECGVEPEHETELQLIAHSIRCLTAIKEVL